MSIMDDLYKDVRLEVESSFEPEELEEFITFDDFFAEVDVQNAYEEEWELHKSRGIAKVYLQVWLDLKAERSK